MSKDFMRENQSGFAVVYGLVILFIATLAGTSLTYITGKDKIASAEMIKMRDSAIAARAALSAFEGQFSSTTTAPTAIAIIDAFCTDNSKRWFFGTVAQSTSERRVYLGGSNSPSYSAKIMSYDPVKRLIQVEGTGRGGYGGIKKAVGIYELGGVTQVVASSGPRNALYLGGGANNSDMTMNVNGDVYLGPINLINSNGGFTVNGNLKIAPGGSTTMNGQLTVNGNGYFQGNFQKQNSSMTVNGKAGFEGILDLQNFNLNMGGDAFFNGNDNGAGFVDMNQHAAKYFTGGGYDPGRIIDFSSRSAVGSLIDIASELGMTSGAEPGTNIVDIENFIIADGGHVYTPAQAGISGGNGVGWGLSNAYSNAALQKWNGFLVIKVTSDFQQANNSGGTFDGKIIWIVETGINATRWYSSGPNSNSLIYLKGNGAITDFGQDNMTSFRGYIYNGSNVQSKYKFREGCDIQGGIYHTNTNSPQFNNNGANPYTLNYNEDIMNEFIGLDLVTPPAAASTVVVQNAALIDTRVRPMLKGVCY